MHIMKYFQSNNHFSFIKKIIIIEISIINYYYCTLKEYVCIYILISKKKDGQKKKKCYM